MFVLISFSVVASANANLVTNGSFELGTLPAPGNFDSLPVGSTRLVGWDITVNEIAWANGTSFGINPSDGVGHLDLFGYHDSFPSGMISQSISTVVGQSYDVLFDVGTYNGNTSQIRVMAGAQFADFTNPNGNNTWMTQSWTFTATSASTLLSFAGGPATSPVHAGLDKISVERAVPEPASIAALVTGLFALRCRRKSS